MVKLNFYKKSRKHAQKNNDCLFIHRMYKNESRNCWKQPTLLVKKKVDSVFQINESAMDLLGKTIDIFPSRVEKRGRFISMDNTIQFCVECCHVQATKRKLNAAISIRTIPVKVEICCFVLPKIPEHLDQAILATRFLRLFFLWYELLHHLFKKICRASSSLNWFMKARRSILQYLSAVTCP